MPNISYSKKLYWIAQAKFWGILVLMILFLIVDIKYGIKYSSFTFKTFELLFSFLTGFLFFPAVRLVFKKIDKIEDKIISQSNSAELGIEGEETVNLWLEELLPKENYKIFRNVELPKYKFDIDFVVTGPKGIILIEAKNFSKNVCFDNDDYLVEKLEKLEICHNDPRKKILYYEQKFREYLEENRVVGIKINSTIVFSEGNNVTLNGKTGIFINRSRKDLNRYLMSLYDDPNYKKDINEKLNKLMEQ